jgi:Tol biopolymer transport system component
MFERGITTGHWDFKPSWSTTGNHLVFFCRLKDDPEVTKWITQLCIINADGSGFHTLSDGTHTDFNPTWTRDGKNTPVWNRKNPKTGGYTILASRIGGQPGEEFAVPTRATARGSTRRSAMVGCWSPAHRRSSAVAIT